MGFFSDLGSIIEDLEESVVTPLTDSVKDSASEISSTIQELKDTVVETIQELSDGDDSH